MALKQSLIKNFLITDTRDFSLKVSSNEKNIIEISNLINKNDLINFLNVNSKTQIYFDFTLDNNEALINKSNLFSKIEKIISTTNNQNKELGIWPLYLCCFFIKGQINSKTIKAPIILLPINIYREKNTFIASKISNIVVNEKLNYFLDLQLKTNFTNIFEGIEENNEELTFQKILSIYKDNLSSFNIDFNFTNDFSKYVNENVLDLNKNQNLKIDFSTCITLLDPIGGKIKKDIMEIEDLQIDPFQKKEITKNNDETKKQLIQNDNIIEINNVLNIDQKYAIYSSLKENTIINGPPGTGKSEVISNIIANVLYGGKTVLLSSEKKTALDVVENRLDKLKLLCLSSIDNEYPEFFYNKINDFAKYISSFKKTQNLINWKDNYKKISENFNLIKMNNQNKFLDYDNQELFSKIYLDKKIYNNDSKIIFDFFYSLILIEKIKIKNCYDILLKLINLSNSHKETILFLLNKKSLISDLEDIDKFLNKYDNSKDKEFLLGNFLLDGKIRNKTIFDRKEKPIDFDAKKIISFFIDLKKLNISNLNFLILVKMIDLNYTYEDFEIGILEKYFKLINDKNTDMLLCDTFNNYLVNKNNSSKTASQAILDFYLSNFLKIYENLTSIEKNKINEVFSCATMKKKKNVILFANKYYEQLKLIFPIWIMNPIKASIVIPNIQNAFDYGIFDEASQMFLERGFSLIYRSNISIIAGDDKQLKPSSFFSSRNDDEENDQDFDTAESLLEKAQSCMWSTYILRNHYRSDSSSLIEFSNKFFYNDLLYFVTKNNCFYKSIEVIDVKGIWENNTNEIEANKVIETISNNLNLYKTILIISFNEKQSDLIEKKFIEKYNSNDNVLSLYSENKICFKSLENAQGNEADLVILSISFGFTPENKFNQYFGPLSQKNGENRLNVAITRSKSKMIIIKSFKSTDLKINQSNNSAQIFYYYISFLDSIKEKENNFIENKKENNKFSDYIYNLILKNLSPNFKILRNISIGSIPTDILISNVENSKVYLIVNINKIINLSDYQLTVENLYSNLFLNTRDYDILSIDEQEWWFRSKKINDIIISKIKNINKIDINFIAKEKDLEKKENELLDNNLINNKEETFDVKENSKADINLNIENNLDGKNNNLDNNSDELVKDFFGKKNGEENEQ